MRDRAVRSAQRLALRSVGWTLLAAALAAPARGEHLLNWITIDTGGGDASNTYLVRGTVGQPDAGAPSSGGPYGLVGGFWRGAIALSTRLIFADGFENGGSDTWSDVTPLGPDGFASPASTALARDPGASAD